MKSGSIQINRQIGFFLAAILCWNGLLGQDFTRYFADSAELQTAFSIHKDRNGLLWVGGNRLSQQSDLLQAYLYRLKPNGEIHRRYYFPSSFYQTWTGMTETSPGKLAACFSSQSQGGLTEQFLVRLDSSGILDIRKIPGLDNAVLDDVSAFDAQSVLLCGFRGGTGNQGNNFFLARIHLESAEPAWVYEEDITQTEHIRRAIRSRDGNILACGDILQQGYNPYVIKLDSNGNFIWDKSLTSTWNDGSQDILEDSAGRIWVIGESSTAAGSLFDSQISCLDPNGEILFQKWLGGPGQDAAFALRPALQNGFWVGGYSNATALGGPISPFLMRLDRHGESRGESFWPMPAPSPVYDMLTEGDTAFYFCGISNNQAYVIRRIRPPLSPVFVTHIPTPDLPAPSSIRPDEAFSVYTPEGKIIARGMGPEDWQHFLTNPRNRGLHLRKRTKEDGENRWDRILICE